MDKRGLSAVVTTLIIILLVLVSTGIIWVVIRNLVSEGAEGIDLSKFTFDLTIKRAYMDGTDVLVSVRRSPGGGEMVGINFVFLNETDSMVIQKNISLDELDEKSFVFNSTDVPGIGAGDDVSIAPIYLSNSGRETAGDITDTEEIGGSPPAGGEGAPEGAGGCVPACDPITEECVGEICVPLGGGECIPACVGPIPYCVGGECKECTDNVHCITEPLLVCSSAGSCVECVSDSDCETEWQVCNIGTTQCEQDSPQNLGMISTVWPPSNIVYFDSPNLPTDLATAAEWNLDHYVSFTDSSEARCIDLFELMISDGVDSYIRLSGFGGTYPQIGGGENYSVWKTNNCGVDPNP